MDAVCISFEGSMDYKDYYATLGVPREASADDIKHAYRKLARKFHPDLNKAADAEKQFQAVGEAYEVLKDPEKRAAYDDVGKRWQGGGAGQPPPPDWNTGYEFRDFDAGGGGGADFGDHSDFFEALFGRARAQARARERAMPRDHHARVAIDLEDAYRGARRQLRLQVPQAGADGRVSLHERTLDVTIPKGVREGQHLRLAGQGFGGAPGEPAGDLFLEIVFNAHPHFRVDGRDVTVDLPVAPWEAALGGTVKVPVPDGAIEMNIPAGSGDGRKLRLKGKGIPGKTPGDLYVLLQVVMPGAQDAAALAAWRDLAKANAGFNPRAAMGV